MQAGTTTYIKCASDSDRTLSSRGHHNKTCLKISTNALRPSHERHSKKFETADRRSDCLGYFLKNFLFILAYNVACNSNAI